MKQDENAGLYFLDDEELTARLRKRVKVVLGVELERFIEGYPLGEFRSRGVAHDLAAMARQLGLLGEGIGARR